MPRKRFSVSKRRSLTSQEFEFSVPCPYSACISRLKDLDATLKSSYVMVMEASLKKTGVSSPPRIEVHDTGESASFEWYSNGRVMVQGTIQSVTSESTRFVGTAYYANDYGAALIVFVILLAIIIFPFLSAYIQPSSSSNLTASIDMRCVVALFAIPIGFAVLLGVGFIFQTDGTINRLMDVFDDCAAA